MEEKNNFAVSIIMATYNRAHFIEESLKYISHQNFSDFECLIIDDGSSDKTSETVFNSIHIDNRFKYFSRSKKYKKGLSGCRNYGLDIASGKYVVFFDDDDIVHPDLLNISVELLKKSNGDFCRYEKKPFSGEWDPGMISKSSDVDIKAVNIDQLEEVLTGKIAFPSCCVLWKMKCFENIRFNEELHYAEEWECYSRIITSGYSGISIDKVLYFNRKHFKSITGEFRNNNPLRKESQIKAIRLVLANLKRKELLTSSLVKHFLRLGFQFKNYELIDYILYQSRATFLKKVKYKLGYMCYPLLKPIFNFKGKFLKY